MNLGELLERTLPPMGYELVDWDTSARSGLVRVFIDKPDGVDVEDCARVSHHLTHLFAVENVDFERLEVSSPGLDRPLQESSPISPASPARKSTLTIARRRSTTRGGSKAFCAALRRRAVSSSRPTTGVRSIPLDNIDKARLVPKIEWRKAR